jgi:hypothetical protein
LDQHWNTILVGIAYTPIKITGLNFDEDSDDGTPAENANQYLQARKNVEYVEVDGQLGLPSIMSAVNFYHLL